MTQIPDLTPEDICREQPSPLRVLDMRLPDGELMPRDSDRVVMIPMYADAARACRISSAFREAGVLTLGMSEAAVDKDVKVFDGIIYTDRTECENPVEEMVRQIELFGPVKIGVCDLPWLFHDNCRAMIKLFHVYHADRSFQKLLESVSGDFSRMNFVEGERIALILTINPHESSFIIDELKRLWHPEQFIPEKVDLIWGVHFDNSLPHNSAGALSIIAGEKPLEMTFFQLPSESIVGKRTKRTMTD